MEELTEIQVDPNEPSCAVKIGKGLKKKLAQLFTEFLSLNRDMFAWAHTNLVGIHPEVMCHWLTIDPQAKPERQKRRALNSNRYKAFQDEVDHLLKVGFIRESYYSDWLANTVLVIKPNQIWRTCIDFTNLNMACPKNSFSLP